MEILSQHAPRLLERAMLPVAKTGAGGGTAFLFNYLVERGLPGDGDTVARFLVTTRDVAAGAIGTLGLVRNMIRPPGQASDELAFPEWSDHWLRPADNHIDLAFLPFTHLEDHARRKGWAWDTQQVTDGMLPKVGEQLSLLADEVAVYGYEDGAAGQLADAKPVLRPVAVQNVADTLVVAGSQAVLPGAPVLALAHRVEGYRFVVAGMTGSATASTDGSVVRSFIAGAVIRSAAQEIFEGLARQ